jgi:hypothetical protein
LTSNAETKYVMNMSTVKSNLTVEPLPGQPRNPNLKDPVTAGPKVDLVTMVTNVRSSTTNPIKATAKIKAKTKIKAIAKTDLRAKTLGMAKGKITAKADLNPQKVKVKVKIKTRTVPARTRQKVRVSAVLRLQVKKTEHLVDITSKEHVLGAKENVTSGIHQFAKTGKLANVTATNVSTFIVKLKPLQAELAAMLSNKTHSPQNLKRTRPKATMPLVEHVWRSPRRAPLLQKASILKIIPKSVLTARLGSQLESKKLDCLKVQIGTGLPADSGSTDIGTQVTQNLRPRIRIQQNLFVSAQISVLNLLFETLKKRIQKFKLTKRTSSVSDLRPPRPFAKEPLTPKSKRSIGNKNITQVQAIKAGQHNPLVSFSSIAEHPFT